MFIQANKVVGSHASARQANHADPTELSVAMKKTLFAIALLLVASTIVATQTQTRPRTSGDSDQSAPPQSAAVRDRVVGLKASNHAEKQKSLTEPKDQAPSVSTSNDDGRVNSATQDVRPGWGNTAVVIRPGSNERIAPAEVPAVNPVPADSDNKAPRKLVQTTSLLAEALTPPSPARASSNSRPLNSARAPALTSTYNVGVGDVLDIRLSNLPTRESTLFTVLKNGVLEYPLLSTPISVVGLTTEEIAKLLGDEIKVIKSARVTVTVRDYASHAVVITGLVDSPGRKALRREAMPLYAVLAEALPRPEASAATIVRKEKEGEVLPLNNEQALTILVLPGDVIKVTGAADATAKKFLYVGGQVASPGEKLFREGMTLTQALLSAGGASRTAKTIVKVARRNADGFLSSRDYNLRAIEEGKAPDPVLEAGDRIEVTRIM